MRLVEKAAAGLLTSAALVTVLALAQGEEPPPRSPRGTNVPACEPVEPVRLADGRVIVASDCR